MIPRVKEFISDILELMEIHISSAPIELNLLWCLLLLCLLTSRSMLNLTINLNEAKKDFGKKGGCQAVVKALTAYREQLDVQQACLAAVLQFSSKSLDLLILTLISASL